MSLTGKGRTHSGTHPTLTATLTQPRGQANLRSVRVVLPLSLALDPNNSQHVCSYDVAQAVHGGPVGCPASTIVGHATAITPLLSQPLSGPVYVVQGLRCRSGQPTVQGTCPDGQTPIRTLPSLLIPLRGQIAIDLRAKTSVSGGHLVTTFSAIPDAAVSRFVLTITGGPRGILVITGRGRSICGKAQVASATLGAQSGKREFLDPRLAMPACKAVKHKQRHGKSRKSKRHAVLRTADAFAWRRPAL